MSQFKIGDRIMSTDKCRIAEIRDYYEGKIIANHETCYTVLFENVGRGRTNHTYVLFGQEMRLIGTV